MRLKALLACGLLLAGCTEDDSATATGAPALVRSVQVSTSAPAPGQGSTVEPGAVLQVAYTVTNQGDGTARAGGGSTRLAHAVVRLASGAPLECIDPPASAVQTTFTLPAGRSLGCLLQWTVPSDLLDESITVEISDVFAPGTITTTTILVAASAPGASG